MVVSQRDRELPQLVLCVGILQAGCSHNRAEAGDQELPLKVGLVSLWSASLEEPVDAVLVLDPSIDLRGLHALRRKLSKLYLYLGFERMETNLERSQERNCCESLCSHRKIRVDDRIAKVGQRGRILPR